jgi:prophage DNA circulation protein
MPVASIRDLAQISPWRWRLLPAHFDGYMFHVESGSRESGRRIVTHEFPKKDLPYSEDMGRRAIEFSVRGYIIQFVGDANMGLVAKNNIYQRDYTQARDLLQQRLDTAGPGPLQLPLAAPIMVVCTRYRLTEEERAGGYCVFDMGFVELGASPFQPQPDATGNLSAQSQALAARVQQVMSGIETKARAISAATPRMITPF